jgi:hypothetical protein
VKRHLRCTIWRVSWRQADGDTASKVFRNGAAAQRFIERMHQRGFRVEVHAADVVWGPATVERSGGYLFLRREDRP